MLHHFNQALDALRGDKSEADLATLLGISSDVLLRYRRGAFPKNMRKVAAHPTLLEALARDQQHIPTSDAFATDDAELVTD